MFFGICNLQGYCLHYLKLLLRDSWLVYMPALPLALHIIESVNLSLIISGCTSLSIWYHLLDSINCSSLIQLRCTFCSFVPVNKCAVYLLVGSWGSCIPCPKFDGTYCRVSIAYTLISTSVPQCFHLVSTRLQVPMMVVVLAAGLYDQAMLFWHMCSALLRYIEKRFRTFFTKTKNIFKK